MALWSFYRNRSVDDKTANDINNDLVDGDSAFCQPKEALLNEGSAEVNSVFAG